MNRTLYINHLGQIDLAEVEYLFSSVGDVTHVSATMTPGSKSGARYGTVIMATEQQATDCIERFNGQEALGQTLSVSRYKPRSTPLAKDDLTSCDGKVVDHAGGGIYKIELENGIRVSAKLCGKMKRFRIRVVVGDRVSVGLSPYDPTHGLVLHRHRS